MKPSELASCPPDYILVTLRAWTLTERAAAPDRGERHIGRHVPRIGASRFNTDGPILTGGIIGSFLMGTIEGAAVGAAVGGGSAVFAAALAGMGIPKNSVIQYEADLKANRFLLIASGTPAQVEQARAVLAERGTTAVVHPR